MYVFYISLASKNGHGRLPEHNLSINHHQSTISAVAIAGCVDCSTSIIVIAI